METNRMEAFSDGVLAIVITITVLGLKVPSGTGTKELLLLVSHILIYAMSFVYVGSYWNNHHHTVHTVHMVNGKILWSNLFFLFWISLLPFATNWMSQDPDAWIPTFGYGIVLVMTALGYGLLQHVIIKNETHCDTLKKAVEDGRWKSRITGILYLAALIICPFLVHVSQAIYLGLLLLWVIPDRNIARHYHSDFGPDSDGHCDNGGQP